MVLLMTSSPSSQPFPWFWDTEFVHGLLSPTAPQATQDMELLRQLPFLYGLKELLMLRQVHALEHATVWMLSNPSRQWQAYRPDAAIDNDVFGGMSTDRGFYLYGNVSIQELRQAAQTALHRITSGDWDLAVHPRCGTNLSVGMLLTAGFAIGMSVLLPRGPIEQLMGLGVAAATAAHLAPDVGRLAQQYVTTAIPFNLAIATITPVHDPFSRPAHFVQVRWIDS